MKIALAQLNYYIGDFEANFSKIRSAIEIAGAQGADLIVFSELAVSGYPARDFLEDESFIATCLSQLLRISALCTRIGCIIGCPVKNTGAAGKKLHNAAFFIQNGKIESQINKALLPTYDVFDEYRYFEPASTFNCIHFKGHKIAITICEDIWNVHESLYVINPMDELMKEKPSLMINIAASPFHYSQAETRHKVLRANVEKYRIPLVYVNHVGAQTELVFDGGSLAFSHEGEIIRQLMSFEEEVAIVELDCAGTPGTYISQAGTSGNDAQLENLHERQLKLQQAVFSSDLYTGRIYQALVLGIKDYFRKSGFRSAVLGLSGGIDSALVCTLAAHAIGPENVHAVLMPSEFSSDHSVKDALDLVENLGTQSYSVPIHALSEAFDNSLKPIFKDLPFNTTEENIQARSRGIVLMAFSNKFGHILLNTSNKSEAAVGYGTLYGDMCGALSVLGDVYKSQVFDLCRYINRNSIIIPVNTIEKPPSAELRPDQKDSDSLPDYALLDQILFLHIECIWSISDLVAGGFDQALVTRVIKMVNNAEFKRYQAAPILRVSPKAFGMGRRMPIVGKYS